MFSKFTSQFLSTIIVAIVSYTVLAADKPTMGIVVKIGGIPWFNAMQTGIKQRADELDVDAIMIGPTSTDPALQVRAIEDLIAKNYPVMKLIGERYGAAENVDDSRRTALDLMSANPNLGGFLAFGSQDPIGAGRAIEQRRKIGSVRVIGPFSPGQGRTLVKSGAISGGFMWNPAAAGRIFVTLGDMLAKGVAFTEGMEIPDLGVIHPDGHNIITNNLIAINAKTVDKLADLGL